MPHRTKQTARVVKPMTPEQRKAHDAVQKKQRKEHEAKAAAKALANRIKIIFNRPRISDYFAPTAPIGTFKHDMEFKIFESVDTKLSELEWRFEGDRGALLKKLKIALGGRLYSRDLITMWCKEGLAIVDEPTPSK